MLSEKSYRIRIVTILADLSVTILAFLLAFLIRDFFGRVDPADFLSHVALLPLVLAIWSFFLSYFGAYRSPRESSLFDYGWAVARVVTVGLVVLLTLLFLVKIKYVSRAIVVMFAGLDFFGLLLIRLWVVWHFRRSLRNGDTHLQVLIIGTGSRASRISKVLRGNTEWGLHILGHLDPDDAMVGESIGDAKVLGTVGDISLVLKDHVIDEVILAIPRAMIADAEQIAYACEEEGVRFSVMADVFNVQVARMELIEFGGLPLLTL
ncbi:MAG: hypothetical protein WBM29_13005, partial [Candidatus Deferrimicrobium sp.]